jgi:hypothetical protein
VIPQNAAALETTAAPLEMKKQPAKMDTWLFILAKIVNIHAALRTVKLALGVSMDTPT